jgi:hypothetical protein
MTVQVGLVREGRSSCQCSFCAAATEVLDVASASSSGVSALQRGSLTQAKMADQEVDEGPHPNRQALVRHGKRVNVLAVSAIDSG